MTYRGRTNFRKPERTKIGQKIALMQCIMHRESFSERDIEGLSRGYGQSVDVVRSMVAEELARREARRVGAV